jgi:hypothetical protein
MVLFNFLQHYFYKKSRMKKILIAVGVVVVIAVSGWLGASIYVGRTAATIIANLSARAGQNAAIRLTEVNHKQGLFSSAGQFEIRFNEVAVDAKSGNQMFALQVNYSVENLLLPSSSMRFKWEVKPVGKNGVEFNRLFGSEIKLTGQGKLAYGGKALSTLKLPELAMKQGKELFHLSPSSGNIVWGDKTVALQWKTDRLSSRGDDHALDINGLSFTSDIQNRARGLGAMQFAIDKFSTKEATAESIAVNVAINENNAKLELNVTPTIASLTVAGQKLSDLALEFVVKGLDIASIDTLSAIGNDSNDFRNLTADEQTRASGALQNLVAKGFSIGLPKISAKMGTGSVKGDLLIEVSKPAGSAADKFSFAQSVKANGKLEAQGRIIDNTQKRLALMLGLATETREGLRASFQFANGSVRANGKSHDVRDNLAYFDELINAKLYPK